MHYLIPAQKHEITNNINYASLSGEGCISFYIIHNKMITETLQNVANICK